MLGKEGVEVYDIYTAESKRKLEQFLEDTVFLPERDKIYKIMKYEDKFLICYNVYKLPDLMGYEPYRNIWCFHKDGKLLWRIQQDAEDKKYCDIYSGVFIERDTGKLKAATGFGMVYDLDIETGAVSNPDFRK